MRARVNQVSWWKITAVAAVACCSSRDGLRFESPGVRSGPFLSLVLTRAQSQPMHTWNQAAWTPRGGEGEDDPEADDHTALLVLDESVGPVGGCGTAKGSKCVVATIHTIR